MISIDANILLYAANEDCPELIASYRSHPRWMILGWPSSSLRIHDVLWKEAGSHDFPRRKIIDLRTAMVLIEQGVREFATANIRHFTDVGFDRVWNPLD